VTVYPPARSGNVKPLATIRGGADTRISRPMSIALDSSAKPEIDRITVYPALGDRVENLDERPIITVEGSHTELETADGIAVLGPTEAPTGDYPPIGK